jgi:hypothetical protein
VIDYCELSSIILLQQRFDVLENLKFLQHDQKINAVHLEEQERERKILLCPAGRESQKRLLIVVMMRLSVGLTSTV